MGNEYNSQAFFTPEKVKELPITESWKEVKEYIEYCFGWRVYCNAITYTSTSLFLEPRMQAVEDEIQKAEKYKKVVEIIKEKKWLVEDILEAFIEDKEKYDFLKEFLK